MSHCDIDCVIWEWRHLSTNPLTADGREELLFRMAHHPTRCGSVDLLWQTQRDRTHTNLEQHLRTGWLWESHNSSIDIWLKNSSRIWARIQCSHKKTRPVLLRGGPNALLSPVEMLKRIFYLQINSCPGNTSYSVRSQSWWQMNNVCPPNI